MRLVIALPLAALLSACAAPSASGDDAAAAYEPRCEAPTGSRLARCDRGVARTMTREELERVAPRSPGSVAQ